MSTECTLSPVITACTLQNCGGRPGMSPPSVGGGPTVTAGVGKEVIGASPNASEGASVSSVSPPLVVVGSIVNS